MVIGVSGRMNTGKDTVCGIIQYLTSPFRDDMGYEAYTEFLHIGTDRFENKKYSAKLKEIVSILLGCSVRQLEEREFKESVLPEEWWCYKVHGVLYPYLNGNLGHIEEYVQNSELIKMTPRLLLQVLGTECGRNLIHPNIWINATYADYDPELSNWILTDTRFVNEADAVLDRNGILIRVTRSAVEEHGIETVPHESETALDNYTRFKYTILNNGTLGDLVESVRKILIAEKII